MRPSETTQAWDNNDLQHKWDDDTGGAESDMRGESIRDNSNLG